MALRLLDIKPIQAVKGDLPKDQEGWQFEVKYDGYRAPMQLGPTFCQVSSKNQKQQNFDALAKKVREALRVKSAIFDGEIIVREPGSGRPNFEDLYYRRREPVYIAFDVLWLEGQDLRALSLRDRRKILEMFVPESGPVVERSFALEGRGDVLFSRMCEFKMEGVVAKRLKDPYAPGVKWIKILNPDYPQIIGRDKLFRRKRR